MQLEFSYHPSQMLIFESQKRMKAVAAGRRFGKSFYAVSTCIIEGLKSENQYGYDVTDKEVWYVAPTFQQAKDIAWDLFKKLGKDVIEKTIENTATIYLINGRKIQLKGSDRPDTLRGSGLSYVVMDEYAFMKPFVWDEIILPTLTEVKGGALFIGTPAGKNHFYDLFMNALKDEEEEWDAWHFNSTDNPILDNELIESYRNKLSTHVFRQEFEASFESTGGNIFHEEWFKVSTDEPDDAQYYITVDPAGFSDVKEISKGNAKRLDETAIAIVKVGPSGWWVRQIDHGRWGVRETALRIIKHAKDIKPVCVAIEKGSLKNAIMPYLEDYMRKLSIYPRIEELTHGGNKKTDRITWALQGRMEHGRISFNKGEWTKTCKEQLLDFPNPLSHDDLIDALAYVDQVASTIYATDFEIDDWAPLDINAGY
jgi:hypothetical protein